MPLTCKRTWAYRLTPVSAICVSSLKKQEVSGAAQNHRPEYTFIPFAATKKKPEHLSPAKCQPVLHLDGQRSRNRSPPQGTLLQNVSAPSRSWSSQTNLSINTGIRLDQPSQTDSVSSNKSSPFPNTYLLRPESLNPLANGFLSIFRRVICECD